MRRSIVPFLVGSQRIASLQDLKKVIAESPEKLIIPLQDGRLERFLRGISNSYLECIDKDNPKESIERLAEKLGVKIQKEFTYDTVSVVTSVDELVKMIAEGENEVEIPKGEFLLDDLTLASPIKLIGQGKNETRLKVKTLTIASEGVTFENLLCEAGVLLLMHKPEIKNSYFKFKSNVSQDMAFIRGVGEDFEPKRIKIEITEPIILEGKKIFYENVDFVFKEKGSITFNNCDGVINNCSFSLEGMESNILFKRSTKIEINYCEFKGCDKVTGITTEGKASLQIFNCRFVDNRVAVEGKDESTVIISKCKFLKNSWGLFLRHKSRGIITDSIFDGNKERGIAAINYSKLEAVNCKFINHVGGENSLKPGIYLLEKSVGEVKDCEFFKNNKGIQIEGGATLKVESSKFIENSDIGILGRDNSRIEVVKCKFLKNGRGIFLYVLSQGIITDSIFDGNKESGIEARAYSKLEVVGCEFMNHIGEDGKRVGIYLLENNVTTVKNCKFLKNNRGIDVEDNAKLKVENCKFIENKNYSEESDLIGGGIYGFDNSQLEVFKCEFLKNGQGVLLRHESYGTVKGSVFDSNIWRGICVIESSKLEAVGCNCDVIDYDGIHAKISNCKINTLICRDSGVNINSSTISLIKYKGDSKKPAISNSSVGRWEDISGCYITTATCLALGKGDDCYELNMFRWFRDNWLIKQPDGKRLIQVYYETAPLIVNSINKRKDYKDIYLRLWKKYLNPCLNLLEKKDFSKVKKIYVKMVKKLKNEFLY